MSEPLKLNLGCGNNKKSGYLNVDKYGEPEFQWDLEVFPWPWEDSTVDAVLMNHVLEHLGETSEIYLNIIKELYRICKPDAQIDIVVPHPRHDHFITDPTHVRAILPESMSLFSKRLNRYCAEKGFANSPLGLYLDVDFELTRTVMTLDESWQSELQAGKVTQEELSRFARQYNNVIKQISMTLTVIKTPSEALDEASSTELSHA